MGEAKRRKAVLGERYGKTTVVFSCLDDYVAFGEKYLPNYIIENALEFSWDVQFDPVPEDCQVWLVRGLDELLWNPVEAVQQGVAAVLWTDNFAYADAWDETKQRYLGLKAGEYITANLNGQSLLVKPDVAQKQREADAELERQRQEAQAGVSGSTGAKTTTGSYDTSTATGSSSTTVTPPPKKLQRFYGSVDLDPLRVTRDTGLVADEVLQHLTSLLGAKVKVTLEITVEVPDGVPDHVVRTVTENCRTLKFKNQAFEED
jgi:hypothetical protein